MRLPSWRSPGKSACVCLGGWVGGWVGEGGVKPGDKGNLMHLHGSLQGAGAPNDRAELQNSAPRSSL